MDFSSPNLQKEYRTDLNYESLVGAQINRIAESRSKDTRMYIDNVDTLWIMLPLELHDEAAEYKKKHNITIDLTEKGKALYDSFWRFINGLLEKNNIIYKRSSFEMGKE